MLSRAAVPQRWYKSPFLSRVSHSCSHFPHSNMGVLLRLWSFLLAFIFHHGISKTETHMTGFLASNATHISQFTTCECVRGLGDECKHICKQILPTARLVTFDAVPHYHRTRYAKQNWLPKAIVWWLDGWRLERSEYKHSRWTDAYQSPHCSTCTKTLECILQTGEGYQAKLGAVGCFFCRLLCCHYASRNDPTHINCIGAMHGSI